MDFLQNIPIEYLVGGFVAVLLVIRFLSSDKVKARVSEVVKKTKNSNSSNYSELSKALKVLHDHVARVGSEEEQANLDTLARLVLKDIPDED